jgi:hypothetical protein
LNLAARASKHRGFEREPEQEFAASASYVKRCTKHAAVNFTSNITRYPALFFGL